MKIKNVGAHDCAQRGITLIALIITIVLMLILATITVNVVIDGGLFNYAGNAKDSTEVASEKETVQKATILAETTSKTGRVTVEEMQKAIDSITDENIATAIDTDETITVKFNKSNRYYEINSKGDVEYLGKLKEKILNVQCTDSTGRILSEKTYNILKNKYSIALPEIEGYEASEEKIAGEISESKTIQALYYLVLEDDTTLVFTGLDESGNVTSEETSIESYMVGDNTSTYGNAVIQKEVQSIVEIPETYKGKTVTMIGTNAFCYSDNIIKLTMTKSIEKIKNNAFRGCKNLKSATVVGSLEYYVFSECENLQKVILEDGVSLGLRAFYGATNLKEIVLNGKINLSNNRVFKECSSLTTITLAENNTNYKFKDKILYSSDETSIILVLPTLEGEFIIPNTVQSIGNYACTGTRNYKINNSIYCRYNGDNCLWV